MYQQEALNDFDALLDGEQTAQQTPDADYDDEVEETALVDDEVGVAAGDARAEMKMEIIEPVLQGVRCAAHTVQLAVHDTIKAPEIRHQLNKIRSKVKILRKLPYKRKFEVSGKKKPKLDCVTRWNSTYTMVNSLLEVKAFICSLTEGSDEAIIDNDLWNFIERFTAIFLPISEVTIKLQSSHITFGDFFLIWEKCMFDLRKFEDDMAKTLISKMDNRRVKLMDSPLFLAAIYLDQRINFRNTPFMTKDQKEVAVVSSCIYKYIYYL